MTRARSLGRLVVLGLTLALVCAVPDQPVSAQQQGQLYISVLDSGGQPVSDLEPGDLTVIVDDVECKTVKLEPVSKPTKVTVLIDNGPATTRELANLRTAFKAFVNAMPEKIAMELITLAPQPRWLEKSTMDHAKLIQALDRLAPDSGAALFFDALVEAGNRIDKDKDKDYFPILMMLASDFGRNSSAMDREYERLQKQIIAKAITVHFIQLHAGGERVGSVAGALQTEVGLAVTKLSGGRYENIAASTRLITLLPEFAQSIGQSHTRQMNQYRVTYERPGRNLPNPQRIAASLSRLRIGVSPQLSLDGHMPNPQ
jgi:hypothetical protein